MSDKKCSFGEGIIIKPDGVHELDPCVYEEVETYRNVTVHIMRCKKCGHVEVSWSKQENTEQVFEDEEDEPFGEEDCE